jgi:hypothetical protein
MLKMGGKARERAAVLNGCSSAKVSLLQEIVSQQGEPRHWSLSHKSVKILFHEPFKAGSRYQYSVMAVSSTQSRSSMLIRDHYLIPIRRATTSQTQMWATRRMQKTGAVSKHQLDKQSTLDETDMRFCSSRIQSPYSS